MSNYAITKTDKKDKTVYSVVEYYYDRSNEPTEAPYWELIEQFDTEDEAKLFIRKEEDWLK